MDDEVLTTSVSCVPISRNHFVVPQYPPLAYKFPTLLPSFSQFAVSGITIFFSVREKNTVNLEKWRWSRLLSFFAPLPLRRLSLGSHAVRILILCMCRFLFLKLSSLEHQTFGYHKSFCQSASGGKESINLDFLYKSRIWSEQGCPIANICSWSNVSSVGPLVGWYVHRSHSCFSRFLSPVHPSATVWNCFFITKWHQVIGKKSNYVIRLFET